MLELSNEESMMKSRITQRLSNANKQGGRYEELIRDYNHLLKKYKELAEIDEDEEMYRNCCGDYIQQRDEENAMGITTFKNNLDENKELIEKEERVAVLKQGLNHTVRMLRQENQKLKSENDKLKLRHMSKMKAIKQYDDIIYKQDKDYRDYITKSNGNGIDKKVE